MSAQQWFNETAAVVGVLQEYVNGFGSDNDSSAMYADSDEFTAIWQAAELLSRAHAVLVPMVQYEAMKRLALDIPDPVQKEGPKLYVPGRD